MRASKEFTGKIILREVVSTRNGKGISTRAVINGKLRTVKLGDTLNGMHLQCEFISRYMDDRCGIACEPNDTSLPSYHFYAGDEIKRK